MDMSLHAVIGPNSLECSAELFSNATNSIFFMTFSLNLRRFCVVVHPFGPEWLPPRCGPTLRDASFVLTSILGMHFHWLCRTVGSAGSFSDAAWRSSSNRDVAIEGYYSGSLSGRCLSLPHWSPRLLLRLLRSRDLYCHGSVT